MPTRVQSTTDTWVTNEDDIFANGNDGTTSLKRSGNVSVSIDIGRQADTSASSDTGTFSLIALIKRLLTKFAGLPTALGQVAMTASMPVVIASNQTAIPNTEATRTLTLVTGTVATSGDNSIVAAPGAGIKIVVAYLSCQQETVTPTTMIWRGATTALLRVFGQFQSDGAAIAFTPGRELRLANNVALNLNLSSANTVGYTIGYWTE